MASPTGGWDDTSCASFFDSSSYAGSDGDFRSVSQGRVKTGQASGAVSAMSRLNLLSKSVLSRASMKEVITSSDWRNKKSTCVSAGRLKITSENRGTWSSNKTREWQEHQLRMKQEAEDAEEEAKRRRRRTAWRGSPPSQYAQELDYVRGYGHLEGLVFSDRAWRGKGDQDEAAKIHSAYTVYLRARTQKRKDQMDGVPKDFYDRNEPKLIIVRDSKRKSRRSKGQSQATNPSIAAGDEQCKHDQERNEDGKQHDGKSVKQAEGTDAVGSQSAAKPSETLGLQWCLHRRTSPPQPREFSPNNHTTYKLLPVAQAPQGSPPDALRSSETRKVCHKAFPVATGLRQEGLASGQQQWRTPHSGQLDVHKVWSRKTKDLAITPAAMAKFDLKQGLV